MTAIVVTCAKCGREFTPSKDDLLHGRWKLCPACQAMSSSANAPSEPQPPESSGEREEVTTE
jgi:hypothetical protein